MLHARIRQLLALLALSANPLAGCGGASDEPAANPPGGAVPSADAAASAHDAAASATDAMTAGPAPVIGSAADAATPVRNDAGDAGAAPPDSASASVRCEVTGEAMAQTDYGKPGRYAAAKLEVTWEDRTRPIVATAKHGAAPARRLVTTIHYPASGPAPLLGPATLAQGGPFPLLMYSHGYSSNHEEANAFGPRAASHGYIVVAPDFPLTSLLGNGGSPDINDAANQPGDVSFLIDQVLGLARDAKHVLANGVDEARIGALGVSLGGFTTLLVGYHPKFKDARVKAIAPIAPVSYFFAQGFYHTRVLPMLLVHGDLDAFLDYEANARRSFTRAAPHARLLTVAKGTHAAFAFPLDSSGLFGGVLNALLARPDADPSNPDGLGCGAVGDTLAATGVEFLEPLDTPEHFIETTEEEAKRLAPCVGGQYKSPAMNSAEQQEIAVRAVLAFFEAHLGKTPEVRDDGCRYLLREVPKNPAVRLE